MNFASIRVIMKTYNVGIVGATGVVGQEILAQLESFIPVNKLIPFASARSEGKSVKLGGKSVAVTVLKNDSISGVDFAIFSAGATVSKEFAPLFAKNGTFVIDNSSAWRMDPNIPLVVPEVNPEKVTKDSKIIANPNCSTIQMVVALKPLHNAAKIKNIRVATYQSVSGAGQLGIQDLNRQTKAWAENKEIPPSEKIPKQIAFNLVPQIDVFLDDGYTKEEMKMVHETKKIMGDSNIQVSATCVRVPVLRAHSEAVWIETERPLSVEDVRKLLKNAPGVKLLDDPANGKYPMPIIASHSNDTFVGRIRKDLTHPNGLLLWIVSDNLLKGAALNALQIAELIIKKNFI